MLPDRLPWPGLTRLLREHLAEMRPWSVSAGAWVGALADILPERCLVRSTWPGGGHGISRRLCRPGHLYECGWGCEQVLSEDYAKAALLLSDRSVCLHAKYGAHYRTRIPHAGRDLAYIPSTAGAPRPAELRRDGSGRNETPQGHCTRHQRSHSEACWSASGTTFTSTAV